MHVHIVFVEASCCDVPSTFVQDTIALALPTMVAWMDKEVRGLSSVDQVLLFDSRQTLPKHCS